MCNARNDQKRIKRTLAGAQRELLRYHEATAKFNAAIRKSFPRPHKLARSMERHSSGLINDAPEEIQSFVGVLEDAAYLCCPGRGPQDCSDSVSETIDAARAQVGRHQYCEYGEPVFATAVTFVEKALASEMKAAAAALFRSVYQLPCVDEMTGNMLRAEERLFAHKHRQLALDLHRTSFDATPTYTLLLLLRRRFPPDVGPTIVRFLL